MELCRGKPIKGYEGLYDVTECGQVYSLIKRKFLKLTPNNRGYIRVKLYKGTESRTFQVHRLVAEAFIPNPDNKLTVNHIDGNKTNNNVSNLEWATNLENNIHAIRTGLNSTDRAIETTKKRVKQFSREGELIKIWDSLSEASRTLNIPVANITHCCKGRIRHAGGYIWTLEQ